MSNLSLMNPGTSINFDGAALQNQEEAEYRKEEEQQQHELRQLLTNAFDDLIDDDILSVTSDDSVNVSGHFDPLESGRTPRRKRAGGLTPSAKPKNDWGYNEYSAQAIQAPQKETHDPRFNQIATYNQAQNEVQNFQTPQPLTHDFHLDSDYGSDVKGQGYFQGQEHFQGQSHLQSQDHLKSQGQGRLQWGGSVENLADQYDMLEHQEPSKGKNSQQMKGHDYHDSNPRAALENRVIIGVARGETEGGNEPFHTENKNQFWGQNYAQHYRDIYRHDDIPGGDKHEHYQQDQFQDSHAPTNDFADTHHLGNDIQISFPNGQTYPDNAYRISSDDQQFSLQTEPKRTDYNYEEEFHSSLPSNLNSVMVRHTAHRHEEVPIQPPVSPRKQDFPESYKVRYHGNEPEQIPVKQRNVPEETMTMENVAQKEFVQVADVGEEGRQLSQLQILYKARGRQLEDLTQDMETVKNETAREIRILKHQLNMAQGEREGSQASYKQCQELLQETKDDNAQLLGKLQAVEAQVEGLNITKDQLLKKLQTSETTVENLTQEISNLQQSDSLTRARTQHESIVSSMQQKFDKEILTLKEKLDIANESIYQKTADLGNVRQQLHDMTHASERSQISRAETINRLTHSLEESQKRCHALLESSSSQEVSEMRVTVKQAQASKKISEEMCETLQSEMKELKEQLSMFESASSLGVFSTTAATTTRGGGGFGDDSMTDLGIRKTLDFSTPGSQGMSESNQSSNELITSLKAELERCLTSNRQKRSQVSKLQDEVRGYKKEFKVLKEDNSRMEKLTEEQKRKLGDFEDLVQPGQKLSAVEQRLRKDIENITREKNAIVEDNEELKKRLDELGANDERLTEINQELTNQISQMVRDYDNDKREALERTERTCESVHVEARDMLRQELETNFSVERAQIVTKYETDIAKLRTELQTALNDLDHVKELYVKAGEERSELEVTLRSEFMQQKEQELKVLRDELEREKDEEFERRKEENGVNREALRAEILEETQTQHEEEMKQEVESEVARAKISWLEENDHHTLREEIRATLETEFTLKHEADIEDLVQAKVEQAKVTWMAERKILLESELQQRLQTEKVTWQQSANQKLEEAVNTAIDHAKEQWLITDSGDNKNYESLLEAAKLKWEEESRLQLSEAVKKTQTEQWEQLDQLLQDRLKAERTKWQLESDALHEVDIKQAVEDAKMTWEAEKESEDHFQHCLETEKQKWQLEADRKLQLEVTKVMERAQKQNLSEEERRGLVEAEVSKRVEAERSHWLQRQESDILGQVEKAVVAGEIEWTKKSEEEKLKMKQIMEEQLGIRLKEEMNKAMEEARVKWENEQVSQNATQKANQSAADVARSLLEQEIETLKAEKTRLNNELRKKESDWLEERQAVIGQKDAERRLAVREVEDQCEKDYQKFMADHQDTLTEALKTSRQQQERLEQEKREMQQRYDEEIMKLRAKQKEGANLSVDFGDEDDLDGSILDQERENWQKENDKLKKSIANRDKLLKQADHHMSKEMEKLRSEMETAYQTHLQEEVQKLRQKYEIELNDSVQTDFDTSRIQVHIQSMAENFEKEKAGYVRKIEHLEEELAEKIKHMKNLELRQDCRKELDKVQVELKLVIEKLDTKQTELNEKVKENEMLRTSVKNMESAYRRDMKTQKERFDEINIRLQKSEKSLHEAKKRNSHEIEALKKAMGESEAAMANLTERMMEKQKSNALILEAQKKQHKTEKKELLKQLKKYCDRNITSTPTQTEESGDMVVDLRCQYLDTVDKIREDVMQHITQTNLRAADTVRAGITREKQVTVTQLKRFYKSSIRKILQSEMIGADLEGKMAAIDQALEALSISISSSRSGSSDNDVKVSDLPQVRGQNASTSISLDDSSAASTPRSVSSAASSGASSASSTNQITTQSRQTRKGLSERDLPKEDISDSKSSKMLKNGKDVFPRSTHNLSLFDQDGSRLESSDSENERTKTRERQKNDKATSFRPVDPPKRNNIAHRSKSEVRNPTPKSTSKVNETLDNDGFVRPKNPPRKITERPKSHTGTSSRQGSQPVRDESLPSVSSRQRPQPQLSLLRRSTEDEFSTPKQLQPFQYQGMTKAQSEIALNTLADFQQTPERNLYEASPSGVQVSYKYTPLRQSLQNGSPSTSLFSNHSLSEGDLRTVENEHSEEQVLNFQSLGLGNPSPRKFNPVPEKLNTESGYHTPKKSPVNLFTKKMTHSLENISWTGLTIEENTLHEEFAPLASVKSDQSSSDSFRDFQRVGSFPSQLSKGRQSDEKIEPDRELSIAQSTVAKANSSHSYREFHKGRQLSNDSGRGSFRSPLMNITSRSSLPPSLRSEK